MSLTVLKSYLPVQVFHMRKHSLRLFLLCFISVFSSGLPAMETEAKQRVATFAGGCFWCMEKPFDILEGVISTTSGYAGGHSDNPTYRQVSLGGTGHTEVVQVVYDPDRVSFEELLEVYWVNVDPLTDNAQFCDRGSQYRAGIFYHDEGQKQAALATLEDVKNKFKDKTVYTEVTQLAKFYPAEDYHQDYYLKSAVKYNYYRWRCGRDARLQELWGKAAKH